MKPKAALQKNLTLVSKTKPMAICCVFTGIGISAPTHHGHNYIKYLKKHKIIFKDI